MRKNSKLKLALFAITLWFSTTVCSSGYITPGSVAATSASAELELAPPTAFYIPPTETATPVSSPTATLEPTKIQIQASVTPALSATPGAPIFYYAQSGDSLSLIATHYGVSEEEVFSPIEIQDGLLPAGQPLIIPNILGEVSSNIRLLPDSELVYSPSAIGFDAQIFGKQLAGHLSTYREYLSGQWHVGGAVIEKAALENSINPRILLSILQYQSNWLIGSPLSPEKEIYPMGYVDDQAKGLYGQVIWTVKQLSFAYYGWREGRLTELEFSNGRQLRIAPDLNAATVALQYLFSQLYDYDEWLLVMDKNEGFPALHASLFPDPWLRAANTEPLFPNGLSQPKLKLPFHQNNIWSYSSGPHGAWDRLGSLAALDFAPSSDLPGCVKSDQWITAVAPGLVVRTGTGVVVLDLDGDGNEQSGWVILYLHLSQENRVELGDWVNEGDLLGFPSCEGGFSTASHLHIARKYNGEWIHAAGPLPFELSGWQTQFDGVPFKGTLTRGTEVRIACTCGNSDTLIAKSNLDP